jgi:hypothetical protein
MRYPGRILCTLLACLAVSIAAAGEEIRLVPTFRYGTIADGVGLANLVPVDLDGDDRAELISCSNYTPFAVSARGDAYVTTWHGPFLNCLAVTAGDRNLDGGAEVIVAGNEQLWILDPRSLSAPVATVALPAGAAGHDVALGNVDDDAQPEIVVLTNDAVLVYDGATLELQWTADGYGGDSVGIGDVDGDARREIVVSGATGYVLDAAAEVEKWGYVGGFGTFALGNVDADAKDEIVFHAGSYSDPVTILHGDTFATTTFPASAVRAIAVGDANGDGANEIITGSSSFGRIEGHAPAGGALLWKIANPEYGTMAVGTAELDGDATREVFWGGGYGSSGADALFVGTPGANAQHDWRSLDLDGPYHSAIGDLDGDGDLEHVVTTYSSGSGYNPGILEVFDVATGLSEGRLPFTSSWGEIAAVAIGQLDGDAALEVAALVDGDLYTWDGVTRLAEFNSSGAGYSELGPGDSLLIANLDGDPVDEVVLSAGSGEQVLVLNGASNIIQKAFPVDGGIRDFAIANLNGGSSSELAVATTSGLTIYDTVSWAPLGSHAATNIFTVDATAADGGTVALGFNYYTYIKLKLLKGATLMPGYQCEDRALVDIAFGEIGDAGTRLLAVDEDGGMRVFPLAAESCPETVATFYSPWPNGMTFADTTGDGRNELIIDEYQSVTIALLGLSSELRGDVDGDDVIATDDVDAAADYLFGLEPGISTTADTNTDGRIGIDDLFVLIDHEFAGGAPLQP